jgi:hypothetical protein
MVSIGTTHLEPVLLVLDDDPLTVRVLGGVWQLEVVVTFIFLDLHVILEVPLEKVRDWCDECSYGLICTLFVSLLMD